MFSSLRHSARSSDTSAADAAELAALHMMSARLMPRTLVNACFLLPSRIAAKILHMEFSKPGADWWISILRLSLAALPYYTAFSRYFFRSPLHWWDAGIIYARIFIFLWVISRRLCAIGCVYCLLIAYFSRCSSTLCLSWLNTPIARWSNRHAYASGAHAY